MILILVGVLLIVLASVLTVADGGRKAMLICGIVLLVLGACMMIGLFGGPGPGWRWY